MANIVLSPGRAYEAVPEPAGGGERQGFLVKVNRHIQRFDGSICRDARNVNCGASDSFRQSNCAIGRAECFDINLFAEREPHFRRMLYYEGADLIKEIQQGDLILFWTYQIHAKPPQNPIICGLYVADGFDVEQGTHPIHTIYPRDDSLVYIDWPLPADAIMRRSLGEHTWARQFPGADLPWLLGYLRDRVAEREQKMRGHQKYDRQLEVLDRLIEEYGVDTDSPLYQVFAASGALNMPLITPEVRAGGGRLGEGAALPAFGSLKPQSPVERMQQAARTRGLHYPPALLLRFHVSAAMHPFVILSGRSGSGKSLLSRVYAEAENAVYAVAQVQPDWVSPSYLWGVYDYMAGLFAPTRIASLLREAAADWDRAKQNGTNPRQYVLCLDEMNLARVEHYFSDVLSAMEQPLEDRRIPLYSAALTDRNGFPNELRLTPNIHFVGTINVDETTHVLSPKVVDRAHLIRVDHVDLAELRRLLNERYDVRLLDVIFRHLEEIHRRMADDPAQQFGYRVAQQIVDWVATASSQPYSLPLETALDAAISQKILPRLQIDPDNESQLAMFDKLLTYFEQFERATPGFDETLRWLRTRQDRLQQAEAVSGQQ